MLLSATASQGGEEQGGAYAAFSAISSAERAGANVSALVAQLNGLIDPPGENGTSASNSTVLQAQFSSIIAQAQLLGNYSSSSEQAVFLPTVVLVPLVVVLGVACCLVLPDIFWLVWLRSKKGWKVRA